MPRKDMKYKIRINVIWDILQLNLPLWIVKALQSWSSDISGLCLTIYKPAKCSLLSIVWFVNGPSRGGGGEERCWVSP